MRSITKTIRQNFEKKKSSLNDAIDYNLYASRLILITYLYFNRLLGTCRLKFVFEIEFQLFEFTKVIV